MKNLQKEIQLLLNLYKAKKLSKAELFNKKLISTHPKVVILYNILGLILTAQEKVDEAIEYYERGIKIEPDYAMIYNNLGSIYKSRENYSKAENYYKKSINLDNKIPEPQNNLGNLYRELNKYQEAIVCYKNAIRNNSKFFVSHYNLGIAYKSIGNFEESKKHLKESIKLNTYFCPAHRILSQITKYKLNNDHFVALKKLYGDNKVNNEQKAELAFALGKANEDIRNFSEAFKYYSKGNNLHRKNLEFSIKDEKREFNDIKKIFGQKLFDKFKQSGNLNSTPIFILGMPRSGTTLIEQILSSHPKVFGGDELDFLPNLVKKYFKDKGKGILLEDIINSDKEDLKVLGQEYINSIRKISNNSERVTDKLPINFKWIGLIKLILPNSKIVHCIRNAKDNCLSIFTNYFVNTKLNYAYNLREITIFYNLYSKLMRHWKSTLSEFVIDIKYEKVIHNPEKQIRDLLKKCELGWDSNCLKFYDNKRVIKTASDIQVRKKIYKGSVNSWKNYEKYLGNVFKQLPN